MDDEERKDQRENDSLISKLRNKTKKENKSDFLMKLKKAFAFIASIKMVALLLFFLISFTIIFACLSVIFDKEGDSAMVDSATSTLIEEDVSIAESSNGQGHYFKIDGKIMEKFLLELNRAYAEGKYHEAYVPELGEDDRDYSNGGSSIDDFVYNEETAEIKKDEMENWFRTEEYDEFMIKMIRAQIASSYPKLGEYTGEKGTEDKVRKYER